MAMKKKGGKAKRGSTRKSGAKRSPARKKGAAKKKTGQSMEDGRDMDIPMAALVGARKGLVYCLVGLISHKRYSSKVLQPCHAMALLSHPEYA